MQLPETRCCCIECVHHPRHGNPDATLAYIEVKCFEPRACIHVSASGRAEESVVCWGRKVGRRGEGGETPNEPLQLVREDEVPQG